MNPTKLPPLAEVLRDRAESFSRTAMYVDPLPEGRLWRARRDEARAAAEEAAPYDTELSRLRAENAELRRVGAILAELLEWSDPGTPSERVAALEEWDRIQDSALDSRCDGRP